MQTSRETGDTPRYQYFCKRAWPPKRDLYMDPLRRDGGRETTWLDCKPESEDSFTTRTSALGHKLGLHPGDGGSTYPFALRAKLYRSNHIVALVSASLALLVLFPLIWTFGLPRLEISSEWVKFKDFEGHEGLLGARRRDQFLLGVGKADITGPVVELNLMGYANSSQVGTGLRQRLYSRAFIIGSVTNSRNRFVYLVLDTQSGDTAVRYGIISAIAALGPEYSMYGHKNIAVTGTHSHSGPGAWLNYLLPQITSMGFDKQSYQAIVDGATLSIQRAHECLTPGYLTFGSGDLEDANVNRSPYAYLANPEAERAKYPADVDKTMTLLRFQRAPDQTDMGVLTWFPVHGTSLLGNNTIITADNKGVAARLFEQRIGGSFVAGFSQSNVGDTSPNVNGAWCEDGSGLPCDFEDSTCSGRSQACRGQGPFNAQFDNGAKSCFEIGRKQFKAALSIYNSLDYSGTLIKGGAVQSLYSFHDMANFSFTHPNGTVVSTCPAALGYSFAAGTTDGPGAFDFRQNNSGDPNANPMWAVVGGFLKSPSEEQKACHYPKPILLDVGEVSTPYEWTPNIVDIQLLRAGQLIFIVSPGEATSMSGRRWKEAIADAVSNTGIIGEGVDPLVVLGGPANTYAHYITTEEEYCVQRYEGASTLYGPNTLNAYINISVSYVPYLATKANKSPPTGPSPPNNVNTSLSFITGVVYDNPPYGRSFGEVIADVNPSYAKGDIASVTFVGANPRNNLRLEGTFIAVEKRNRDGSWTAVRDDNDWSLVYAWKRTSSMLGTSEVTATWEVDGTAGTYRFRYYGDSKTPFSGLVHEFTGVSSIFKITRSR
ncbi:hypothetical protein FGG08_006410 [Glutinoglossum americanum]|uniref:Neutral ceramidase n=1 Tax=Glutinoglossum americanum TaxID=1670608 RepID=A0A9P8I3I2_9PEZI|nr:hypothetical protein FGG08_006410 [Glutinoglossum americanum]